MTHDSKFGDGNLLRAGMAAGLLLAMVLATAMVAPREVTSMERVHLAGAIGAVGTLAMAGVFARSMRYPLRAYWITAFLMAAGQLASAYAVPSPQFWAQHVRTSAWMLPWFFMTLGSVPPRSGVCAASSRWASWMLIGTGLLFSIILLVPAMVRR